MQVTPGELIPVPAIVRWYFELPIGAAIRDSMWLTPAIESVHLIGLTMLMGGVVLTNLRLLGIGMRRQPAAAVITGMRRWMLTGLGMLLATGPMLASASAVKLYESPAFYTKMALLPLALLFHFTVFRKTVLEGAGARSRWTAAMSLALWFGVASAGLVVAF